MSKERTIFNIIGERYLDTWFEQSQIDSFEAELRERGVVGVKRWLYEYIAASGLWWNLLWWEWTWLDESDVKAGWRLNLISFGVPALILSVFTGLVGGAVTFLILHAITLCIGLLLRKGTGPQNPK